METITNVADHSQFVGGISQKTKADTDENGCYVTLNTQDTPVRFKVDTGSQANIIPHSIFMKMENRPKLKPTNTKLISYTGEDLKISGSCELRCGEQVLNFFIVRTNQCPILSFKASQELNLIKVVMNVTTQEIDGLIAVYSTVFEGLGCLDQPYHIKIDDTVQPIICPPRNIPVALRERVRDEIDRMEKLGILKKVEEPTAWVSSLVVVEKHKTGKLRLCLDPRHLNKAIQREHFQLPTIEDIATRLTGAKVFSTLDANHGYWQIPLDPASQRLTTFNTPFGRYCYTRMPFGVKSAQEIFQKRMVQHFGDLPGVKTDIDDILVWGATKEEHNQRLKAVIQRCKDIHMTLNKEKCSFGSSKVVYLGHIISAEGISPDPEKVKAIDQMPPPEDKKGVERLLGLLNYVAKFIPDLSSITQPIRELLKKEVMFHWDHEQETAFQLIKKRMTSAPVLAFYDVKKAVTVSCDASNFGLGAVLLQGNKPIAYASRALTDTEKRYAQIEKELLAVVYALEKFNQYVYGKTVQVESDHKPLESITKKSLCQAPPRLQRMLLRLQKYDFILNYKPGKEMVIADTLSRPCYIDTNTDRMEEELSCAIHMTVALYDTPTSDVRLQEVKEATKKDSTLQLLRQTVQSGWPRKRTQVPKEVQEYWNIRDEISETDGLIMKGERLVIPTDLRTEMLKRIHTGHMGIVKCSQRAKELMFWPGMYKAIESMVNQCDTCQEHRGSNQKEPMIPGPTPSHPWEEVATDLFHWNDHDYLIIVDYFSRYIEVCKLEDTTSKSVITHTKSVLARHGIPMVIRSDNGSQYTAEEYQRFTKEWGIKHVTTSPYHPQANGLAEKSVQIIKSLLNKSKANNQDPYLSLLEYRNTTVDNVGSPAQLLMGRKLRATLPVTTSQLKPKIIPSEVVQRTLTQKRSTQKWYHDQGAKPLPELKKGDQAYMQVNSKWLPIVVTDMAKTPRSYVVRRPDGRMYRRNRKHLRAKTQARNNDHKATTQTETQSEGERGDGAVQNKDPQQETSTEEEDTDVREVQPEPEVAQNEDQQQEGQTEEDVESETQSGPNVQQAQENKEPGRPKRAMKPPQKYKDYVKS